MGRLEKSKALSGEQKASSSVLWLAVLEPDTRGHRLLGAMGLDAEVLRGVVLTALAGPEGPSRAGRASTVTTREIATFWPGR